MSNILIQHEGRTSGPFTAQELRLYSAQGHVTPTTQAWTEGLIDWAALPDVLALLAERTAVAAPPEFTALDRRVIVPDGVRGFSWAGLLMAPIWSPGNRVWIGLVSLIPGIGQVVMVWLGFSGRELAWRTGRWAKVSDFQRSQRRWDLAAWVGFAAAVLLTALVVATSAPQRAAPAIGTQRQQEPPPREKAAQPREAPLPPQTPDREAPGVGRAMTRSAFEARFKGRSAADVEATLGRPAHVQQSQGVLVYAYRGVTLQPGSGERDEVALIGFAQGAATVFRFVARGED